MGKVLPTVLGNAEWLSVYPVRGGMEEERVVYGREGRRHGGVVGEGERGRQA